MSNYANIKEQNIQHWKYCTLLAQKRCNKAQQAEEKHIY